MTLTTVILTWEMCDGSYVYGNLTGDMFLKLCVCVGGGWLYREKIRSKREERRLGIREELKKEDSKKGVDGQAKKRRNEIRTAT